ncbi:MAG TPA: hypothetical protein VFL85_02725, partial [Candidatus Saccharimonadales bacterium]|nr:hypothetical protein [Candidatus Saccharimonadales bacterium]
FVLIIGLWFLAYRWPQGIHATFSRHAAARNLTIWYYIVLFVVALPILFVFFAFWFVPYFNLSRWFLVIVGLSEILQHIVTFIPEVGGWKSKWHGILTACSAVLLLPALLIVISSAAIGPAGKAIAAICLLVMVSIVAYQVFKPESQKPRYLLLFQAAYYGAFFAAIISVTYLS